MRPERLYLTDIVEAADAIACFLEGIEAAAFMQDELPQSAVLQKLIVIGEAAQAVQALYRRTPGNPMARHCRVSQYRRPRVFCRGLTHRLDDGHAGGAAPAGTNRPLAGGNRR